MSALDVNVRLSQAIERSNARDDASEITTVDDEAGHGERFLRIKVER